MEKTSQSSENAAPQDVGQPGEMLTWRQLAVSVLGAALLTLSLQQLRSLQLIEWAVFDQWIRQRPNLIQPPPLVVVSIDDDDIESLGQWPLSDQQLADLLVQLQAQNPAAIGLNLYRDIPIQPGSDALQQILQETPTIIGVEKIIGHGSSSAIAPPPGLPSQRVAFNDLVLDRDGSLRRHLLSVRRDGQTHFSLGTKLALMYLQQKHGVFPDAGSNNRIELGQAQFSPLRPNSSAYVGADVGGYQILADYWRWDFGISSVSLREVLNQEIPDDLLDQKIVLIGLKADSSWGDRFYTPHTQASNETWSGTELHANLAAQLIASALGETSVLRSPPELLEYGWLGVWIIIGVVCHRRLSADWRYFLRLPAIAALLTVTTYLFFLAHYWLPLIAPLFAFVSASLFTQGLLTRQKLRQEKQLLERVIQKRTEELVQQNKDLEQARLEAEFANQSKGKFLAFISHELRTPLTAILGFGELLGRSPNLPKVESSYAKTIHQCSENLLALVNNVLELSKIENNAVQYNPEPVSLQTLLDEIDRMFQAQVEAKGLSFQIILDENIPDWIQVDADKLRQILINLVSNAIKFTEQGRVSVQVEPSSVSVLPQPSDRKPFHSASHAIQPSDVCLLTFSVTDTGPGIKENETKKLFQPFVQAQAGKALGQGSGLGLSFAYQWIELMGGQLDVLTTYGEGSCFFFQLPVQPAQAIIDNAGNPKHSIAHPMAHPMASNAQEYRILIVDDEANTRRLLTRWLLQDNVSIRTARTGSMALKTFERWHPDCILLDIHLPDIDGYEVARRIRNLASQAKDTSWLENEDPVILAVTAGVLQENYAELLAAGCDDVLWKPLKSETLFQKIAEYLLDAPV